MTTRAAALVLAAGSSSRMGTSKQLLRLGNKTVIRHCVDTIADAGIADIVVVCGANRDDCATELEGTGAVIVKNDAVNSHMADSTRIGIQTIEGELDYSGVIIALSDHPLVTEKTYRTIVRYHHEMPGRIVIPAFKGRRGHPCLFPAEVVCDIFFMTSLRDVVHEDKNRVMIIDVPDEGVVLNMDTPEDYRTVCERFLDRGDGKPGGRHVQRE